MLYHVHTCIAIFFHISYNPVSTHSINQNNYYKLCFTKTVETLWLTKPKRISHYFWFHKMLLISHVSSRPNWYSAHAGCNQRFFVFVFVCLFFFSKIATILVIWKSSDREVTVGLLKKVSALFQSYSKTVANPLHGNFFFLSLYIALLTGVGSWLTSDIKPPDLKTAAHLWLNGIYTQPVTCSKGPKVPFAVTRHNLNIWSTFLNIWSQLFKIVDLSTSEKVWFKMV